MKPRALALALMAAGATLSGPTRASDDFCTRLIVYSVQQMCQFLGNGLTQCQPVGLAGPPPGCAKPGAPQYFPVVMGPPAIQMPPLMPTAPAMPNPYLSWNYPVAPPLAMPMPAPPVSLMPYPLPDAATTAIRPAIRPAPAPTAPGETAKVATAEPTPAPAVAPMPATVVPKAGGELDNLAAAGTVAAPAPSPEPAPAPIHTPEPAPTPAPAPALAAEPAPPPAANGDTVIDEAKAHFAFDSAQLTDAGRAAIDAWLENVPKGARVRLTGHADRLGPVPYNLDLSRQRAESVQRYLVEKGFDAGNITLIAMGENAPVKRCPGGATPATKACLAPNRRVEIESDH